MVIILCELRIMSITKDYLYQNCLLSPLKGSANQNSLGPNPAHGLICMAWEQKIPLLHF